jgi:hypothetical protein
MSFITGDYFASGGVDNMLMIWKTNFLNTGVEVYDD